MGFLSEGTPVPWKDISGKADYVRRHGIKQFINHYKKNKDRQNDDFYWGDEIEHLLVKFDHEKKTCQLLLTASKLLKVLQQPEIQSPGNTMSLWRPEYSDCSLESCPGKPFGSQLSDLSLVEANMNFRHEEVKRLLGPDEALVTLTSFPRTCCANFMYPPPKPQPHSEESLSHSLSFSDVDIVSSHPRFRTFSRCLTRRGQDQFAVNIPIFKDKNTLSPFVGDFSQHGDDGQTKRVAKPDHIFMDVIAIGLTCCCLQTTVQASDIQEAFIIYDNLANLCPVMLALSAAAPIFRGYLVDSDCRWNVLAQSVDDRTEEERGIKPLKNDRFLINKSRYDSIDSYLSEMGRCYNDLDLVYDKDIFGQLKDADIDDLLAKHIAHLFIRDPICLIAEKIHQDDSKDTDNFESIQSTNWQTLRFKPPPPNSNIGWRVEFRPMEVQLSDFENAAYVVFIVLVTRAILTFKLNFIIPISKVDENMVTAQKKDAVREGLFYFRKDVITANSPPEISECVVCSECNDKEYTLMSLNEIINGKDLIYSKEANRNRLPKSILNAGILKEQSCLPFQEDFPGLIPLVNKYLDYSECDVDTRCTVQQYLQLISDRASGKLMTMAQWTRKFVLTHADYKQDSVVNESITYDLLVECEKIASGEKACPELFFKYSTRTRDNIPAAVSKSNLNRTISASI